MLWSPWDLGVLVCSKHMVLGRIPDFCLLPACVLEKTVHCQGHRAIVIWPTCDKNPVQNSASLQKSSQTFRTVSAELKVVRKTIKPCKKEIPDQEGAVQTAPVCGSHRSFCPGMCMQTCTHAHPPVMHRHRCADRNRPLLPLRCPPAVAAERRALRPRLCVWAQKVIFVAESSKWDRQSQRIRERER